ncbi:MAG: OmpA family protein [Acidiferrobacterales bacterium]|nr:OmpA family protein [Acidiferrobacterales bacterium]
MRNGKIFCVGWLPILLCSLALLFVTMLFEWRDIEKKVQRSANDALQDQRFSWAKVETFNRGRKVLITGAAPNQDSIDAALAKVRDAYGVYDAEHNGEALALPNKDPELIIQLRGNTVNLSGVLANQKEIDQLLIALRTNFQANKINSTLFVGDRIKPLTDTSMLTALKPSDYPEDRLEIQLQRGEIRASGQLTGKANVQAMRTAMRRQGSKVLNQIKTIDPPLKASECEDMFKELLANTQIVFNSGKSEISEDSQTLLARIVQTAQKCPDAKFEVAGHTDSVGNLEFNTRLSQQRAEAVVNYLTRSGLSDEQFDPVGYGPKRPIAGNDSAEGRAKNRRIEFTLRK